MSFLRAVVLFAVLAAHAHAHRTPSLTGRWHVIATSKGQNLDGRVCVVVDIVRHTGNKTHKVYEYQYNFNEKVANGTFNTYTSRFQIDDRLIHPQQGAVSWFLEKSKALLVSMNENGVLALARSPGEGLALARLLIGIAGRAEFLPDDTNCSYAPITTARPSLRRLVGEYEAIANGGMGERAAHVRVQWKRANALRITIKYSTGRSVSASLVQYSTFFPARFNYIVDGGEENGTQMWALRIGRVRRGQYEFVVLAAPQLDNVIVMWSTKIRNKQLLPALPARARYVAEIRRSGLSTALP